MKYGRPIGRGMQRGVHVCQRSNKVKYGRPIGWGMQRDAHVCQRSDKVKYGTPIGRGMQRGEERARLTDVRGASCREWRASSQFIIVESFLF